MAKKVEKPYIFVSYSHRDGDKVMKYIKYLESAGFNVWYDEGIDPGTEWANSIAQYLKGCDVFVVFLSATAIESQNVKREIYYAIKHKKQMYSIYLEDVEDMLDEGLDMQLGIVQAIHAYRYAGEKAEGILKDAIESFMGVPKKIRPKKIEVIRKPIFIEKSQDHDKQENDPHDLVRNHSSNVRDTNKLSKIQGKEEKYNFSYAQDEPYHAPSIKLLNEYSDKITVDQKEVEKTTRLIIETLSYFNIEAEVKDITVGTTITRYDIAIPMGINVHSVICCADDIAQGINAYEGVCIYPNPKNGTISIEVPNKERVNVGLASIIQDPSFQKAKETSLMVCLGKDVDGRNVCGDFIDMAHLIVAGSVGSGKSIFLNNLIVSLIMKHSPKDLRLILIDPKQVDFGMYQDLPHLMLNEIVGIPARVQFVLDWILQEIDRRYSLFQQKMQNGYIVGDLSHYNKVVPIEEQLPKIVVMIDELSELMITAKNEIERKLMSILQKSRAAGIHVVIATHCVSPSVLTGVIKACVPTRIAFRVSQGVDSRIILDTPGAEKLLGQGDMLYKSAGMYAPCRLQCAFVSTEEVYSIVSYVKENNASVYDPSIVEYLDRAEIQEKSKEEKYADSDEVDSVFVEALAYVVMIGQASISMIQRRCGISYNRAGKIIDWMESKGYVTPFEGAKPRTVLLTREKFEKLYGEIE